MPMAGVGRGRSSLFSPLTPARPLDLNTLVFVYFFRSPLNALVLVVNSVVENSLSGSSLLAIGKRKKEAGSNNRSGLRSIFSHSERVESHSHAVWSYITSRE